MAPAPDRIAVLLPIAVAVTLTFSTVIIQAVGLMGIIHFVRYELRFKRGGVQFWRDVGIITGVVLVALAAHVVAIVTWGLLFSLCGEFSQLAGAVYHSGMNYTTLGDSDKVMSPSWKLLAPLEAANGMLMFGVSTTMLFAVIQRLIQSRHAESGDSTAHQDKQGERDVIGAIDPPWSPRSKRRFGNS